MNERMHKWTWDDFRPKVQTRIGKEIELLSCLWQHPSVFFQIAENGLRVRFTKSLHGDIFCALRQLSEHNDSIDMFQVFEMLKSDESSDEMRRQVTGLLTLRCAAITRTTASIFDLASELAD